MKSKTNRTVSIKIAALIAAIVLVIGCTAGGTVAWLVSKPDPITNVFTVGNINATLTETKTEFKIVPGVDITKNPVATVKANSEDCYLFVQLTEANWPAFTEADSTTRKVEYKIADGWTKLKDGVYYREVTKSDTEDQSFHVLQGDKVTVSNTLTKENADAIAGTPQLTVAVYAVQKEGMGSANKAWETATAKDN